MTNIQPRLSQPMPERVDEVKGCTCDDPTVAQIAALVANGADLIATCRQIYGGAA